MSARIRDVRFTQKNGHAERLGNNEAVASFGAKLLLYLEIRYIVER